MKLSPQWIRDFVDLTVDDLRLAEDLTNVGISVEGISGAGADTVFEMEIGTNRPDAMNHYGVAREAAAIYDAPLKAIDTGRGTASAVPLSSPKTAASAAEVSFPITVEEPQLCPRCSARVIRKTKLNTTPDKVDHLRPANLCLLPLRTRRRFRINLPFLRSGGANDSGIRRRRTDRRCHRRGLAAPGSGPRLAAHFRGAAHSRRQSRCRPGLSSAEASRIHPDSGRPAERRIPRDHPQLAPRRRTRDRCNRRDCAPAWLRQIRKHAPSLQRRRDGATEREGGSRPAHASSGPGL